MPNKPGPGVGPGLEAPCRPRVLCLCQSAAPYREQACLEQVELVTVPNVRSMVEYLTGNPVNGILLEVRALLRASAHEKGILQEFVEAFPVLRVNVVQRKEGPVLKALGCLEEFLASSCGEFPARLVRSDLRHRLHLPVLLAREQDPGLLDPEKTYTLDLSTQGMFLFSTQDWSKEQRVWVQCRGMSVAEEALGDELRWPPIAAHIEWHRPWGVPHVLAGIGVRFEDIDPDLHALLCSRYLLRQSFPTPDVEDVRAAVSSLEGEG